MGDLVENLCNIISILMMRQEVEELRIEPAELIVMTLANHGRALSFGVQDGAMTVKLGPGGEISPPGSIEINDLIDELRGH